jgi:hypothetical protein
VEQGLGAISTMESDVWFLLKYFSSFQSSTTQQFLKNMLVSFLKPKVQYFAQVELKTKVSILIRF